ncbi:MAG: DNA sulfur modification protein DndB [Cyanobacteriota bacterium]|nr:DNA sulfur modification protein DndB [Cyanobacteriota bacterium]
MSDTKLHQLDAESRLQEVLEAYFSEYHREKCYVGLIFEQGKRRMLQINVPAHDLPTLLQAKPSTGNDPDSGKNRPEVKGHVEEIKKYILKRSKNNNPWVLGTITANIDPEKIKIIELGRGICFIVIPRGVKLDITDGQHRKRAIHELIESSDGEFIGNNDFPITLILEEDIEQCQTDFRDMAQTKALDKSLLLSFGEFEGRVGITKKLIEQVSMFYQKTEKIKNSPSSKRKLIYTTNYIASFVGYSFTNDPKNELADYDVEEASDALIQCLNQFFCECRYTSKIAQTPVESLSVSDIELFKKDCLLGTSVGLHILGCLLYCIYDKYNTSFNSDQVYRLTQINWSKKGELWQDNVVIVDSQNIAKPYKISTGASPRKIAVSQAKAALGWDELA